MRFTIFALILLTPLPAAAQVTGQRDVEEIRKNARAHVGPFYLTPRLQLKELGVDTNVFNQAGDRKSDFMFNLSPGLEVWMPVTRRALFGVSGGTDLVWYREYAGERSIDPELTARAEVYFNRLTLFGEHSYLNTRQRLNFDIDLRSRTQRQDLFGGFGYRVTPKLTLEVAGRAGRIRYDADDQIGGVSLHQTMNRNLAGVTVSARHRLTPLTSLVLRAERFQEEFLLSPERDSTSVRLMPGVEFKPRALVSGFAHVGVRRFTPENPALMPGFSGLAAQLGLSHTIGGAATVGVSYSRDVNYSFERMQPYYVSNSVGASVRRALGRRFDLLGSVDRHTYDYQDLLAPGGSTAAQPPRVDTTWTYGGSLGWRPNRTTRVGFGVTYFRRESTTVTFREYTGLRAGTSVTYGF